MSPARDERRQAVLGLLATHGDGATDELREALVSWFFGRFSSVADPEAQEQDRQQAETDADALLAGPLAPLLASMNTRLIPAKVPLGERAEAVRNAAFDPREVR